MIGIGAVTAPVTFAVAEKVAAPVTGLIGEGAAAWTPADLTGLALWLDADDASTITLNGSDVSQWDDKSGGGNNASQATAAFQPAYVASSISGKSALEFDGSDDTLLTSFTIPDNHTVFYIARSDGQTGTGSLLRPVWSSQGGDPTLVGSGATRDPTLQLDFYILSTRITSVANSFLDNETLLAGSTYDGVALSGFKNGSPYSTPLAVSPSGFSSATIGGDTADVTRRFHGAIGEIVMLDDAISPTDRQKLEGYLAWKWGLAENLPLDHPYRVDGSFFGYGSYRAFSPSDSDLLVTSDGDVFIV